LDPQNGFLRNDDSVEVAVDFNIISYQNGSSALPPPNESSNVLKTNPLVPSTLGQHSTHIHQQAKEEKQEIVEKKSIVPTKEVPVQIEGQSKGEVPVPKSSSEKKNVSKSMFLF
jgi:hypothetical protein